MDDEKIAKIKNYHLWFLFLFKFLINLYKSLFNQPNQSHFPSFLIKFTKFIKFYILNNKNC